MKLAIATVVLLMASSASGQYYGSSNQAYRAASGGTALVRNPGPVHPAHCIMCLGNHLMSSHGYSYPQLNAIGYRQWQTLHDNLHNPKPKKVMVYAPSPLPVISTALKLADLKPGMVFVDLGCGDGRVVVKAAWMYGCKAVGVDLDKAQVEKARTLAKEHGVEQLTKFYWADVTNVSLNKVDVVYCYLEASTMDELAYRFATMKPGSKLISYAHTTKRLRTQYHDNKHDLYMWTSPSYRMEN